MPLVNVRMSKDERDELKEFARKHKMGISEIIRTGISYVKMVHTLRTGKQIEAVQEILMGSVREALGDTIRDFEEKAKQKLQSSEFVAKFKSEVQPELENKFREITETYKKVKPYRKRRGRPPSLRSRGRPLG